MIRSSLEDRASVDRRDERKTHHVFFAALAAAGMGYMPEQAKRVIFAQPNESGEHSTHYHYRWVASVVASHHMYEAFAQAQTGASDDLG